MPKKKHDDHASRDQRRVRTVVAQPGDASDEDRERARRNRERLLEYDAQKRNRTDR